MDCMFMHGEGMPFRHVPAPVIRVSARSEDECWMYQFPVPLWKDAVRRVMSDMREGKLPDLAAGGLLELIAEAVSDDD